MYSRIWGVFTAPADKTTSRVALSVNVEPINFVVNRSLAHRSRDESEALFTGSVLSELNTSEYWSSIFSPCLDDPCHKRVHEDIEILSRECW